jgi:beta-barrel assembly-enhancing protease
MSRIRNRMLQVLCLAAVVGAAPTGMAEAQVGSVLGRAAKAKNTVDQARDLIITEKEEVAMGAAISEKLRQKYGVVQNQAVHKYVTLVGRVVASSSAKPNLTWHFVVLDTDGVNAFAAPGGYVHITRGALALIRNESELAGVLGHEIAHVTEQHTIKAIKKSKWVDAGAGALTQNQLLDRFTQAAYENIVENGFDRDDENESDELGLKMANGAGYAPTGLGAFLTKLAERNKDLKERSGAFASHPETRSRLDRLKNQITKDKLTGSATVAARYTSTITYKPIPVTAVVTVAAGAAPKAADADAEKKSGGSRFGVGSLTSKLGGEKTSDATVASAGSRGVNPDRDAKGGSNPRVISVTVTAADLAAFRAGIAG